MSLDVLVLQSTSFLCVDPSREASIALHGFYILQGARPHASIPYVFAKLSFHALTSPRISQIMLLIMAAVIRNRQATNF